MRLSGISLMDNVYCTDTHDAETVMLESQSLDKVLYEFGSEDRIRGLDDDIRTLLLQNGLPLGYFRWLSTSYGLNLKFEGLKFGSFIGRDFHVNIDKLFEAIKNNSNRHDLADGLKEEVLELVDEGDQNPYDICCGHDLVDILAVGLRKSFGNVYGRTITPILVSTHLRTGYETNYFESTRLYESIRNWENHNPGYRVFPD
jgi:hypothetical protein